MSDRINVQVTVNNDSRSAEAGGGLAASASPQTLADLKKQRSMSRVAQKNSPSPQTQHHNNSSQSSKSSSHPTPSGQQQQQQQARGSSSPGKSRHKNNAASEAVEAIGRTGKSKSGSGRKSGSSSGQQNRNSSRRKSSNSNVKKFAAGTNEVIGPSPKKAGCCRVM